MRWLVPFTILCVIGGCDRCSGDPHDPDVYNKINSDDVTTDDPSPEAPPPSPASLDAHTDPTANGAGTDRKEVVDDDRLSKIREMTILKSLEGGAKPSTGGFDDSVEEDDRNIEKAVETLHHGAEDMPEL